MVFVSVQINNKTTFLVCLTWIEDAAEISVFDFEAVKTWNGQIAAEDNQNMASQLKLNMADYKSQLDQSLKSCSESFQLTLNDTNTLMIKKFTSKDMAFRIAVIPLKKTDPLTSIPEIMRIIAKSITSMSNDLNEKEKTIAEIQNSNSQLAKRCVKYSKIIEALPISLYTNFAMAFNQLKERYVDLSPDGQTASKNQSKPAGTFPQELDNEKPSTSQLEQDYGGDTDVDTGDSDEHVNESSESGT